MHLPWDRLHEPANGLDVAHQGIRFSRAATAAFVGATIVSVVALANPCRADDSLQVQIAKTSARLQVHYDEVKRAMGVTGTADLDDRIQSDVSGLKSIEPPPGFALADWMDRIGHVVALDSSLVRQAIAGKSDPIAGVRGLAERLIVSRADGTLQPFALYVPPNLPANPSLVILLHGRPQTEAEVLSTPYFRTLADSTGTIVAAPYGRGIYDFAPPADDEVYQVLDAVVAAYHIGPHHVYLVGYSMGGFSVFKVGPLHGERWAAVMSISGAILNSEAASVQRAFRTTPMYVVNGALDDSIPAQYGEMTAAFLAGIGIPTEFDQGPTGTHIIATFVPALSNAWHNMIAGVVRNPPPQSVGHLLLSAPPSMPSGVRP